MKKLYFILLSGFFINLSAQEKISINHKKEVGIELEKYPVGIITAVTHNYFFKESWALRLRVGGNFADRGNASGLNDEEIANGFGGSIGILKYIPCWNGNFIFGATTDTWNTWTKWKDFSEVVQQGKTYTLVIQPWINTGYLYNFSKNFNAGISLGFGKEINVITRGEEVGQGLMGSIQLSINHTLN